ncbi:MAG: hypothetical protein DCC75_00975 [Proteobacteria bacterium]|nr:MAG: hypothetical protein DCC75_00975 [Pseudomonadota bacterium]
MIELWGRTLSFLSPGLLPLLPAAVLLLAWAYFRRGSGKRVIVASLLLLQNFRRPAESRKKFVPPKRFFLDLALLACLLLAAAGLFLRNSAEKIAILIDNSLSMAAAAQSGGRSRFDLALDAAKARAASLPGTFQVFQSAPALTQIDKAGLSASEAADSLRKIEVKYAPDNLEQSVVKLLGDPSLDRIIVVSDRKPAQMPPFAEPKLEFPALGDGQLTSQNLAVGEVAFDRSSPDGGGRLAADLVSHAGVKSSIALKVFGLIAEAGDWSLIEKRELEIAPQGRKRLTFNELSPEYAAFKVELEVAAPSPTFKVNSLKEDDVAYISLATSDKKALLVSEVNPKALGLDKLAAWSFDWIKPNEFLEKSRKEAPGLTDSYSFALFHQFTPPRSHNLNSIILAPKANSDFFKVISPTSKATVTSWSDEHPLLSYLNMPLLQPANALPLESTSFLRSLIDTNEGALLLAGVHEERKNAVYGFELLPFEGRKTPLSSILLLNALKWAGESSLELGFQRTGSLLKFGSRPDELRYVPSGPRLVLPEDSSALVVEAPGVIGAAYSSKPVDLRAFNFFDDMESNTQFENPLTVSPPQLSAVQASEDDRPWIRELALAALVFLLLELLLFMILPNLRAGRSGRTA